MNTKARSINTSHLATTGMNAIMVSKYLWQVASFRVKRELQILTPNPLEIEPNGLN